MNADGVPSTPTSGPLGITESDKWRAARIGMAAETMLTDRVKISAEAAYLPWVQFNGTDQHFVGNPGMLASFSQEGASSGHGVQIEVLMSYYLTPQWSVGVGGRYWGLWTSNGWELCMFGCGGPSSPPQSLRAQAAQAGAFFQTSYRFDWGRAIGAR
jgi:hypothetical protein